MATERQAGVTRALFAALALGVVGLSYTSTVDKTLQAADQNASDARGTAGLVYLSGEEAPRDSTSALASLQTAANEGEAKAQLNLGLAYARGEGVPKNLAKAVEWYRKAAEQGDAGAQPPRACVRPRRGSGQGPSDRGGVVPQSSRAG